MPTLLQWSETTGYGATIKLDNGDVVHVAVSRWRVSVRQWDLSSLPNAVLSRFFGPKLYIQAGADGIARTAAALSTIYPGYEPGLPAFTNLMLAVFVNAICHCGSADEVRAVLNDAAAKQAEQT